MDYFFWHYLDIAKRVSDKISRLTCSFVFTILFLQVFEVKFIVATDIISLLLYSAVGLGISRAREVAKQNLITLRNNEFSI
jgi:hypothetical protein